MKIVIQEEDFDVGQEVSRLREHAGDTGAIITFSGLVREFQGEARIESLTLEHYPGMTENSLEQIGREAESRWSIIDATIIHRIGELETGEQIVLVAVSSSHRQAAFDACAFIMDYLKTRAPFWKKYRDANGEHWIEAKESDRQAALQWVQR